MTSSIAPDSSTAYEKCYATCPNEYISLLLPCFFFFSGHNLILICEVSLFPTLKTRNLTFLLDCLNCTVTKN